MTLHSEDCRSFSAFGRELRLASIGCIALALASCGSGKPEGEVVATVNGHEITAQDLDAEARANGLLNADRNRPALLKRVINRSLFAQSAHDQKLDDYPGYPSDRVRLEQTALAEKALQKLGQYQTKPSEAQVTAFMASHPFAFADRQKIKLDQVTLNVPAPQTAKSLASLDMVTVFYKRLGLPFQRTSMAVDTLSLANDAAKSIVTLPLGRTFFTSQTNQTTANAVVERQPIRLSSIDESNLAKAMTQRELALERIRAENQRLYANAKIVYAVGYSPK